MNAFDNLLYHVDHGVATISLNRPAVLNAMDISLREELWTALDIAELDEDVRAVLFRGAGDRAFSAGADIAEFGTAPSYVESRQARRDRDLWGRLLHFPKPCVAAIHGYALGAGLELSLYCDIRIAAEDAVLGLPEIALAYLPSAGGSQTLPRLIGPGRALDMILSGEPITAAQALECGLVHKVVPPAQLHTAATEIGQRLASQPSEALRLAKLALVEGADLSLDEAVRLEARLAGRLAAST